MTIQQPRGWELYLISNRKASLEDPSLPHAIVEMAFVFFITEAVPRVLNRTTEIPASAVNDWRLS